MREYKFKRGYEASEERLRELMLKHFGNCEENDGIYVARFGAIEELRAWIKEKKLYVETKTNPNVDEETAMKTIKIYNKFIEELTGYSAKERKKMLMKSVEGV